MNFAAKVAILDRFFAAIPAGDIETVRATYHPAAVIWHNDDDKEQTVAENLPVLRWVARNVTGVAYDEVRQIRMESGQVLQRHVLRGTAPNGQQIEVPAAIMFTFDDDGRITRLEEYLDSAQVAVLRA
jgi:uncharacterized protein